MTAKPDPFFPFMMPDPMTLKAFTNYKKEYEEFARLRKLNPYILNIPQKPVFTPPVLQNPVSLPLRVPELKPTLSSILSEISPPSTTVSSVSSGSEMEPIVKKEELPNSPCLPKQKPEKVKKVPKKKSTK